MLQPGTLLQGRYRVIRLLGQGGFSQTYEVEEGGSAKVLKVLLENYPKAVDLLQREAQVLSQLHYPGVPKVESDGFFVFHPQSSEEPLHCLVMEKIPGLDLKQWLVEGRHRSINQGQALDWLKQLTKILEQLHHQSFFHRDIKPSNIILKPDGQLVLIDFGSVRQITSTYLKKSQASRTGTCLYSSGYAPLEQVDGKAVPQSDFFALGRTFVHLLTGNPPYEFSCDPSTGQLKWRGDAPHVAESLAELIDWLIAPFPGQRPQNTQVILQALAVLAESPQDASLPMANWQAISPEGTALTAVRASPPKITHGVKWSQGGLWGGVTAGILIGIRLLGGLQALEVKTFDQMMQWRPLEGSDQRLLLVEVTKADIKGSGGKFSLPDQTLLQLLRKLNEYRPRAIGLDFYQDGEDRERRPELIQYLQQQQHIVPICSHPDSQTPSGMVTLSQIASTQLGFADVVLDPNNIVRRHLLGVTPPDDSLCQAQYAFSTQLALLYLEAKEYTLTFPTPNIWQLNKPGTEPITFRILGTHQRFYDQPERLRGRQILLNYRRLGAFLGTHQGFYVQPERLRGHQILLNYRRLDDFDDIIDRENRVSLTDILDGQVSPDQLKDKIVFVGVTDPDMKDTFSPPSNPKGIPGVVLHALMISQLISAVEEHRPLLQFGPLWGDFLWILSGSGVGILFTWQLQIDKSAQMRSFLSWGVTSVIILVSLSGVCFVLLLFKGWVLPLIPSALAYGITGGGILLYKKIHVKTDRSPNPLNQTNPPLVKGAK